MGPFRGWPQWAKQLQNLHQRARRLQRREGGNLSLEQAAALTERLAERRRGAPDPFMRTRPHAEWSRVRRMPRAPYADPTDNVAYRKANAIPEAPDLPSPDPEWYIAPGPGPEELAISAEAIRAAMTLLSEQQRRVVWLSVDGWKRKEIAALMGLSKATVDTHFLRARKKLVAVLEKEAA